jgi:hypothetical protein
MNSRIAQMASGAPLLGYYLGPFGFRLSFWLGFLLDEWPTASPYVSQET